MVDKLSLWQTNPIISIWFQGSHFTVTDNSTIIIILSSIFPLNQLLHLDTSITHYPLHLPCIFCSPIPYLSITSDDTKSSKSFSPSSLFVCSYSNLYNIFLPRILWLSLAVPNRLTKVLENELNLRILMC